MTPRPYEIDVGGWSDGRLSIAVQVAGRNVIVVEETERGVRPEPEIRDVAVLSPEDRELALADVWVIYDEWANDDARFLVSIAAEEFSE